MTFEKLLAKLKEDCCTPARNGDDLCTYPMKYGEIKMLLAELAQEYAKARDIVTSQEQ